VYEGVSFKYTLRKCREGAGGRHPSSTPVKGVNVERKPAHLTKFWNEDRYAIHAQHLTPTRFMLFRG